MTPAVLSTVFELLTQADDSLDRAEGGLGLGLPIVRSLVEKHGGTVDAFSEGPGKRSEFVVRLPLVSEAPPVERSAQEVGEPQDSASLRILVIEDNPDILVSTKEMLSIWGYQVECATDLAMTGYGQPEDRRRATDAGFDAHLVKALNAFELQARLANARAR